MRPLEIHCRERILFAQLTIEDKGMGMRDFYLHHKNRLGFFIFRKNDGHWTLAYGNLPEDIKEACIDALIQRFDDDIPEMFYDKGIRQIVRVSQIKDGIWYFYVSDSFTASIKYDKYSKKFEYDFIQKSLLTEDHLNKYVGMILSGKIKWIKG